MNIPKDPVMLLSYVNTKLRDDYSSLNDLCESLSVEESELRTKLSSIGYEYNKELNKFC